MKNLLIACLVGLFIFSSSPLTAEELTKSNFTRLEQAYTEFKKQNYTKAEELILPILQDQPNHPDTNFLLAQIAEKKEDWQSVDMYTSKAFKLKSKQKGLLFATRGYARLKMGQNDLALQDLEKAILYDDLSKENIKHIAQDIETIKATKKKPVQISIAEVEEIKKTENDIAVETIKEELVQKAKIIAETPKVQPPKTDDISIKIKEMYKNISNSQYTEVLSSLKKIKFASEKNNTKGELYFLEGEALWGQDEKQNALEAYKKAEDLSSSQYLLSEIYWRRAEYLQAQGQNREALKWARKSAEAYPESKIRKLQVAYLLIANDKDREATKYFEEVLASGYKLEDGHVLFDTAYTYKRLGDNELLKQYLEKIIDLKDQQKNLSPDEVASLYYARREHADVVRTWGSNTNLQYVKIKDTNALQGIQEFYWQPYYSNGTSLQLFAQYVRTLDARGYESGDKTSYGAFGARYEPFSEYNLVLTLEKLLRIGDKSRDDTRVRVGYSWDIGLEKNPIENNWNYTTFFNEFTYSLEHDEMIYMVEARQGRSFKLDENFVVSPHFFVSADYSSEVWAGNNKWRTYGGPGVHFRQWYREDKYNAPQSYFDVVVQYKVGLDNTENALMINLYNSF